MNIGYLAAMALQQIDIVQFKNHERLTFSPHPKWNAFIGLNGSGKTNALDAIYMTCVFKSFLHHSLDQCVRREQVFFRLVVQDSHGEEVVIKYPRGGSRSITLNGGSVKRLTDIIGRQPVVTIQPIDDYQLLQGSTERRRIIDQALTQMDPQYMDALLKYTKIIRQRNALLKHMRQHRSDRWKEVRVYDPALKQYHQTLYEGRRSIIERMAPYLERYYATIANLRETPTLSYKPSCTPDEYPSALRANETQDLASGRTTIGAHLDDIHMHLDGHQLKSVGSQGQRKSFLIAMKLAIYQILREHNGQRPILLLDDLFDKLDMQRVRNLLRLLDDDAFGQVYISEKDGALLEELFDELELTHHLVTLSS